MSEVFGIGQEVTEFAPRKLAFSRALGPVDGITETKFAEIDTAGAIAREGRINLQEVKIPTVDEIFDDEGFEGLPSQDALAGAISHTEWRKNYPDCYAPDEFLFVPKELDELDVMIAALPAASHPLSAERFSTSVKNDRKRELKLKSRDWVLDIDKGYDDSEIIARREGMAPNTDEFEEVANLAPVISEIEAHSTEPELHDVDLDDREMEEYRRVIGV